MCVKKTLGLIYTRWEKKSVIIYKRAYGAIFWRTGRLDETFEPLLIFRKDAADRVLVFFKRFSNRPVYITQQCSHPVHASRSCCRHFAGGAMDGRRHCTATLRNRLPTVTDDLRSTSRVSVCAHVRIQRSFTTFQCHTPIDLNDDRFRTTNVSRRCRTTDEPTETPRG